MNKKIYFMIFAWFSIMACTTTYAWDKVGYINLQRLVNESKMGKLAKSNIEKLRKEKQAEIDRQQKKIQELDAIIKKNGDLMGALNKAEKTEELQRLYKNFKRMVADAKEELANEDGKLVATILEQADGVLKQVAKNKKYSIILKDPDAIGYLDPKVDITDAVILEFNKLVK